MAKDPTPTNLMSQKKPCLQGQELIQSTPSNEPYVSAPTCEAVTRPLVVAREYIQRRKLKGPPKLKRKHLPLGDFSRFPCCEERDSIERHLDLERDANHRRFLELHNAQRAKHEEVQQLNSEAERLRLELESENGEDDDNVESLQSRLEVLQRSTKQDWEDQQAKVHTQHAEVAALRLQTQQAQRELRMLSARLVAQKEAHQHELGLVMQESELQKTSGPSDDEFRATLDQTQELQASLEAAEALREASNHELQETRKQHEEEVNALNAELASLTMPQQTNGYPSNNNNALQVAAGYVADVRQQNAEVELSRRVAVTTELLEDIRALQRPAEELMQLFGEQLPETKHDSLADIPGSTQWVNALSGSITRLCANLRSRMAGTQQ